MDTVFFLPDSSCGCLKASSDQGAIDVYISQLGEVVLTSQEGEPLECRRFVAVWIAGMCENDGIFGKQVVEFSTVT